MHTTNKGGLKTKLIDNLIIERGLNHYEREYKIDPLQMLALWYNYDLISLDEMQTICKLLALGQIAGLIK